MDWHRDGHGGYEAEHEDHDAHAKITPTTGLNSLSRWLVVTYVFGGEVDRKFFRLVADAKWHAEVVISTACVGPHA